MSNDITRFKQCTTTSAAAAGLVYHVDVLGPEALAVNIQSVTNTRARLNPPSEPCNVAVGEIHVALVFRGLRHLIRVHGIVADDPAELFVGEIAVHGADPVLAIVQIPRTHKIVVITNKNFCQNLAVL